MSNVRKSGPQIQSLYDINYGLDLEGFVLRIKILSAVFGKAKVCQCKNHKFH